MGQYSTETHYLCVECELPTQSITPAPGRLQPVTEQGRGTRAAIMHAALDQFAEHGYLDARVGSIAAAASVAYGTFYKYFRSKRDLVRAILTDVYEDIMASRLALLNAEARPLAERAYPDILETLRSFYRHRTALRVLDVAVGAEPDLAAYIARLHEQAVEGCQVFVEGEAEPGSGFDPYLVSLTINAALEESARAWIRSGDLTGDPVRDDLRMREMARALTAMCVATIAPGVIAEALAVADSEEQAQAS